MPIKKDYFDEQRRHYKTTKIQVFEAFNLNREGEEHKSDVIYLDETYIHSSGSVLLTKQRYCRPFRSSGISLGARWIIVNAGGENGFVPNCFLVYRSTSVSADYHHNMVKDNFTKCVKLNNPNLTRPSFIVMNNSSYHSVRMHKPPTQANRITDIKEWLSANDLHYDDYCRKC